MIPTGRLARGLLAGLALGAFTGATSAQTGPGRVAGVVLDSLSGRVVPGAVVGADVGAALDTTDLDGRFELVLPAGRALLSFRHPRLSEWSVARHHAEVEIPAGGVVEVRLATASPATVLQRACGGAGGVVGGVVRDLLTLVPLPGARVDVQPVGEGRGASPRTVTSGEGGEFFVCVGDAGRVELGARLGPDRSRVVSLDLGGSRTAVRDLFVPASRPAVLGGRVVDGETGEPLDGSAIEVLGTRLRAGTGEDGRFLLRGVPPGAVAIAVERIGYGRGEARLDVAGGDSLDVTFEVFPEAIDLEPMVVSVRGRPPERRRAGTRFDGLDRPEIEKLLPRAVAFDDLLRNANIPGLRVRDAVFQTRAGNRIPGVCVETSRRSTFNAGVCEMVEVYLNDVRIPEAEFFLDNLSPGDIERFELLSAAEAGIRYGATARARNGVLLIHTRGR